jgi:hypothetical protein
VNEYAIKPASIPITTYLVSSLSIIQISMVKVYIRE